MPPTHTHPVRLYTTALIDGYVLPKSIADIAV